MAEGPRLIVESDVQQNDSCQYLRETEDLLAVYGTFFRAEQTVIVYDHAGCEHAEDVENSQQTDSYFLYKQCLADDETNAEHSPCPGPERSFDCEYPGDVFTVVLAAAAE